MLEFLETVETGTKEEVEKARFQVQFVIRPQTEELHDYRGYAGTILSGHFEVGQKVKILPSDIESSISVIEVNGKNVNEAFRGEPVIIHLDDDVDVSRGDTFAPIESLPETEKNLNATICWMDSKSFKSGEKLLLQQNSFRTKAVIKNIAGKIDVHSFELQENEETELKLNDFAKVELKTAEGVSFDPYAENRKTGAFILINENTNNTVAAGIFE